MLCGVKWSVFISFKNAIRITKSLNLNVTKGYATRREECLKNEPKTWKRKGTFNHLYVEIKKQKGKYLLTVRGSLHKFYHDNNSGFFTGIEALASLQGMFDLFEVNASDVHIYYLEVGINLRVWFPVQQYLELNLLYHKKSCCQEDDLKGIGFYFKHDDYWLKIYEKSSQILRFEIKYKSQSKLNGFGIYSGAGIDQCTINKMVDSILPEWNEVVMRGGIDLFNLKNNLSCLNERNLKKLYQYTSLGYQQSYKEELLKARNDGDKRKSESLRVKANRLHNFCLKILRDPIISDGIHGKLAQVMETQVSQFKELWIENVTVSDFDKSRENVTISNHLVLY